MYLDKPDGNRINLMRRLDANGKELSKAVSIAHIGFHGWSKEVSRKDIHAVREASKLDASHGYDSQAFFNGLDDPLSLIKKYKEPLERLAFR
jgi:death-on-curing protein